MENKIVVANMKMYMNISDIKKYLNNLGVLEYENVILCPSSIYIPYFLEKNYNIGIQNVYYENNGAYTGEISVEQIRNIGIKYAIIGHSERRKYLYETDYDINKKLLKVLDNNLTAILCIGEELEDRNKMNTNSILKEQLEICLKNVSKSHEDKIIIAYEPRWSIGTGLIPGIDEISSTVEFIKSFIVDNFKIKVDVIYGGSVNEGNISLLSKIRNVDGFMIGGACVDSDKFLKILDIVYSCDKY